MTEPKDEEEDATVATTVEEALLRFEARIKEEQEAFKNDIREEIKTLAIKQDRTTEKTTSANGYVTFLTGIFIWALNKTWGWVHEHFFGP